MQAPNLPTVVYGGPDPGYTSAKQMQSAVATNLIRFPPGSRREFLEALATRALASLGAEGVAIALKQGDDIVCQASVGAAPQEGSKLEAGSVLSAECMRSAAPVLHSRVSAGSAPAYSILLVPIVENGQTAGLCAAFSARENAFTAEHIASLTEIAGCVLEPRLPEPVADTVKPPEFDPQSLETVEAQIADFAVAEKRRARAALAVKIAAAVLVLCALGASIVPDRVAGWMAPILRRFERPATPPQAPTGGGVRP